MAFSPRLGFHRIYNVQKVLPAVYDDSLSYYELLCKLQCKLDEVTEFCNKLADYDDIQDENLGKAYADLVDLIDARCSELRLLIDQLGSVSLDWDVQHGYRIDSQDAMRDMFNDVTVHSYTIAELDDIFDSMGMTVEGLANCGLSVKGLAVMSHLLTRPQQLGQDLTPQDPISEGALTVQDLIRANLDELGYIYVTN